MLKLATVDDRHPISASRYSFLLKFLPYLLVHLFTFNCVAYIVFNKKPLMHYWELLAIFTGAVCIVSGWPHAPTRDDRVRLIWTQVLHWAAFLVAMNLVLTSDVQQM